MLTSDEAYVNTPGMPGISTFRPGIFVREALTNLHFGTVERHKSFGCVPLIQGTPIT
jgi:hypothetical protein